MQLILEHILLLSIHIYMGGHSLVMLYYILSEYDLQGAKSMTVLTCSDLSLIQYPSYNQNTPLLGSVVVNTVIFDIYTILNTIQSSKSSDLFFICLDRLRLCVLYLGQYVTRSRSAMNRVSGRVNVRHFRPGGDPRVNISKISFVWERTEDFILKYKCKSAYLMRKCLVLRF